MSERRKVKVLKRGDRIRVTHCPGNRRTITFDSWDGWWMVSASGRNDWAAITIDRVNGEPASFVTYDELVDARG